MRLVLLLSWPHVRKHSLRYGLLVAGVALGVAVAVALQAGVRSVRNDFRRTVEQIAGTSQFQVTAGDAGVPEELLPQLQSLPEVKAASLVIEALAEIDGEAGDRVLIFAVDITGDAQLRPWLLRTDGPSAEVDPILFLAQPDSVLVSRSLAEHRDWQISSRFPLQTMDGRKEFTVRGLMVDEHLERVYGGNVIVMDVYGAQKILGRGATVDRIDILLSEDAPLEQARESIQRAAGPEYLVASPSSRGEQFDDLLRAYESLQMMAGLFAAVLGVSMIDASFRLAVTQRRAEIGVLKSLGAVRGQIQRIFVAEGLITGVLGSAVGLLVGVNLHGVVSQTFSTVLRGSYGGMIEQTHQVPLSGSLLALAFGLGVGISLFSCWFPARQAALTSPVELFRPMHYQRGLHPWRPLPLAISALLGIGSFAGALSADSEAVFYCALVLLFFSIVLAVPSLVLTVVRPLRPLFARIFRLEGALALDSIARVPRRTVNTIVVLLLVFAQVVIVAGITRSSKAALRTWIRGAFQADLLLSASGNLSSQSFRFPSSLTGELREVSGVSAVQPLRTVRLPFRGKPVLVFASDCAISEGDPEPVVVAGDWSDICRRTAAGEAVYVADNLASREQLTIGSQVEMRAPGGVLRLPVAGIVQDFSDKDGVLFLSRTVYLEYWGDTTADKFRIHVAPDHSVEEVRGRVRAMLGDRFPATLFAQEEFQDYVTHPSGRRFSSFQIQLGVSIVVAALALANMALISIAERRRELAILRAVGALRNQVRKSILIETFVTGGVSLVLGLATGAVMLAYLLTAVHRYVARTHLEYTFPWNATPWLVGVVGVCGVIAVGAVLPTLGRIPLSVALNRE